MNAVVAFALKQRVLMVALMLFVFVAGFISFINLNIEAYPDPVPPRVEVITQNPGASAEEIERYITIPIEIQMTGIRHVRSIRTISLFGLSDVRVEFTYDYTYDEAESKVINRLSQVPPLPNVTPSISPASPIGEIYRYRIVGPPGYSITDLKTIQDWILERRFKAVPGVMDVSGWAGMTKTYEITVDLDKLLAYGLTLPQMLQTLNNSNINVGGQTINFGPQAAVVRGVGLIHTLDDLRNTMLTSNNGSPVYVKDIAGVIVGHKPRLGIVGQDDDEDIVQGVVLMRRGEQSMPTIRRVEAEVEKINTTGILPPGLRLEKIYDRQELINTTTRTVLHNMIFGIVLIFFVQWMFLGDLRSAVIVAATIPFALFFAITIMVLRGESANLLSVGAIDFGLIVDATVILVENIFRHLGEGEQHHEYAPTGIAQRAGLTGKLRTILRSASEVNQAIFFAAGIIIAGFLPLFTLSGVEGHIFGPMATTYAYAIAGGLIATFTISPALSALLLPERVSETETLIVRSLRRVYKPLLEFAVANRVVTLGGAAILLAFAVLGVRSLGLEFLPHLEEGNLWIRATLPPTISLEEATPYVNRMRQIIRGFPEVVTVISQLGRPDDGTDATGFFNAEFNVPLKPFESWPEGVDKEKLTQQINDALAAEFPGVDFNFSQYIQDNVEEAASGVKGENSVKLYGNDLDAIQKTAYKIKQVMKTVPGVTDLAVFDTVGQPTVNIEIDRERAARYGLAPGDINSTIQAAIGGTAAGNVYEYGSDRNFPIVVRLAPQYRQSLDAIRHITIGAANPSGSGVVPIPLTDVAKVSLVSGPSFIYRESQERYVPIKFSVRDRDLGGAVLEAQRKVADQVALPPGSRLEWVGEFGELQEAIDRLAVAAPLSLALICMLLLLNFGSMTDTMLAASAIPMALVGGIFALVLTGIPFSVSAAIGFVALFGISAMNGIIVIAYFNTLIEAGLERSAAITRACAVRMRPVMMTCIVACVGLLPAALSKGIGSQVQKPLAVVVVGGSFLAPLLILLVMPVLIDIFSRRKAPDRSGSAAACACRVEMLGLKGATSCLLAIGVPLTGCAVGPDFEQPAAPEVAGYTAEPLAQQTASAGIAGGEAQRLVRDLDIPGQWWMLFHSAALNALIEQALNNNPTLPAAEAALGQAWENVYAAQGAFFPTAVASYSPSRNKTATGVVFTSASSGKPWFTLHTAQVVVAYAPDVFGGTRRQVESLMATAEFQRYQVEAVYLTLTSNVVAAAVQEASLRGQIAATEEIIKIETEALGILRKQFELGQVAGADVAAVEATLAQAEATLPPLHKQLSVQRDLLTALIGRLPSQEPVEKFELAALQLPQDLPVSLPSKLVEQRPDIQSAQAQLHAASALIGVAIAAQLPQFALTANAGTVANQIGQLFITPGTAFWTVAGNVAQTIFDAGTLLHKKRAADAAFDEAAAMYRSTVITAFQNVADTLHALQSDAETLKAAYAAERAAFKSLEITRRQLQLGAVTYLALLTAENTYQTALIALVQARAARYADTAALFQALGGGWWNRDDVAPAKAWDIQFIP